MIAVTTPQKGNNMGYESKLYVVEKSSMIGACGKRWAEVIAVFDICKCYAVSDVLRGKPQTDCYIFADDGDTEITEDMYGEPLTESEIADVIKIIEEAQTHEGCKNYRRLPYVLAALKSFEEHKDQWRDVVVLHYGH